MPNHSNTNQILKSILNVCCIFYITTAQAEIITDGTLGEIVSLEAPNYDITPDLGQHIGNNLFHSFELFNLAQGETATFLGRDVQNIIARVTGGQASQLDGELSSNIPKANLYFINPYGIQFGNSMHIDIQGSFHATTADYLKLSDGNEFHARYPDRSILSVADVYSFGFLSDTAAAISITGKGKLNERPDNPDQLHLQPNATLSLIGGDISLSEGSYTTEQITDDDGITQTQILRIPQIEIAGGNIFLISVASQGEVRLDPDLDAGVDIAGIDRFADITLSDFSEIRASGQDYGSVHLIGKNINLDNGSYLSVDIKNNTETGGSVLVRAEQFSLTQGSQIQASTTGLSEGLLMRFEANELHLSGVDSETQSSSTIFQETQTDGDDDDTVGVLEIIAQNVSLDDGSSIYTNTTALKSAPELNISASESLTLKGNNKEQKGSNIYSFSNASGENNDAGSIVISSNNITVLDGAFIGVETFGKGRGGSIRIEKSGDILVRGTDQRGQASRILADAYPQDQRNSVGDAGDIFINADNLTLEQGGNISSSVIAREGEVVGKSGKIEVILTGDLSIEGINPHGENIDGLSSGIRVQAREIGGKTGVAGNIEIMANRVILAHGGEINTNTTGDSNAGNIVINAPYITVSGFATDEDFTQPIAETQKEFQAEFPEQTLAAPFTSSISASTSSYYPQASGNAGTIDITTTEMKLNDAAVITNQTGSRGGGGNISIEVQNIDLQTGSSITSETIGGGHAGNIEITATGTVSLSGTDMDGFASNIGSNSVQLPNDQLIQEAIASEDCDDADFGRNSIEGGDAGGVELRAQNLELRDGSNITSSVIASRGQTAGDGGAVKVYVTGETDIAGYNPHGENIFGVNSGLYVRSMGFPNNVGSGGQLHLETGSLTLKRGGAINSTTNNRANGGNIQIIVQNHADISGYMQLPEEQDALLSQQVFDCLFDFPRKSILYSEVNASSLFGNENAGAAGNIGLTVGSLLLSNQGQISTSGLGASAGILTINSESTIILNQQAKIETDSAQNDGGEITLFADKRIQLSRNSEINTSVRQAAGDAGTITLATNFIITESSQIKTTAIEGNGGNIAINATGIFDRDARDSDEVFNTSSRLGIDGAIELDVLDVNFVALSNPLTSQLQRSQINYSYCDFGDSHFKVKEFTGQRRSPFDWRASSIELLPQ
ncbi:filamentous hemagglutinin N-terminal domain-containing protein [Candidatus Albibeggiatoa sp. nov. NOAA]|uniref:two-partner secretion domain-containing protein n=1 Tax=Candidatus Albibeggiatoa sp. nov. NOAA TaxID=3162724 RepID=UPI0032F9A425|nr:filamentous hemagglutinin N-terminal domain-containing protein [Thiotrichaceae bacterium]